MTIKRRNFLMFLGAGAVTTACGPLLRPGQALTLPPVDPITGDSQLGLQPIQGPMPLSDDDITSAAQIDRYAQYSVVDDLILPNQFTYDVVAAWGDPVGDSRFGYNNDYLSFIETGENEGYLAMNFEYISGIPWLQSYQQVLGKSLPIAPIQAAVEAAGEQGIDAYTLPDDDALKTQIQQICQELLVDQGMGVISLRRTAAGQWQRTNAQVDRRITGISGLEDERYLQSTGPARAVFLKKSGQGYIDQLGDRIIGTFGNCAGGTTPWGTVLSGEENIQNLVPEPVFADGTAFAPGKLPFKMDKGRIWGQGNVFGLAGNKYGWIVEIDPASPDDYGTKHTWLGRYRHEAVGVRVEAGQPLAFYSGCDRRGGHIYKFVSAEPVQNPTDKANSRLLANGMLYAAKFKPDGTGQWISLAVDTPVNPDLPSTITGGLLPLPQRPEGGYFEARQDQAIEQFKQQFKTLDDLYSGSAEEKQGAILIDAHYAANAVGATCTARPEDTEIAPNGSLYIAFTSGADGGDGGPDKRIFKGPNGEEAYEYGFIMHLTETENDPAAMSFQWEMLALGGEPDAGGAGFANPDNLLIDANNNVWMVTDMSSSKLNQAVPVRTEADGKAVSQSSLRGLFGNNGLWFIPTSGANAGNAYLFGMGPMECEVTGPYFTGDQKTLFLAVQHPGEVNGVRQSLATETRQFSMKTTDGQDFIQTREVPVGSNWPTLQPDDPPKPAVVAVRHVEQRCIVT
ncbi:MAG: DUF839 domain-containing protein [Cyanothece sp. SIO1E1]|nr:DUF839 domain-containing protein [Cyanothece sp. SIO1E1]